ncbi:MAG: IS110 family transposase [Nitrospirae bacterium]|nr:IS110 family transposase [Nitrospirota bacterium]
MTEDNRILVGLDVHKDSIAVAVLPPGSDRVTEAPSISNDPGSLRRLADRLSKGGALAFVYEAGPCGYEVHRQITGMGHACEVIAPALTPVRPGDRVKTDRRDAEKLARFYRAGELTPIRVPTREEEAARDLVRIREDALSDRLRARHRLGKFLLRQGRIYRETKAWGVAHRAWLKKERFEFDPLQRTFEGYIRALEETEARLAVLSQQVLDLAEREPYRETVKALRCLKGIDTLGAITLSVEAQEFRRFGKARAFMSYTGAVSSEYSSGEKTRRGSITKAGNAHLRRILVEAAWSYRRPNLEGRSLSERRKGCPPEVVRIAKKAQDRLTRKFARMVGRSKPSQVAAVAVARELSGFVWSIARHVPEGKTA